MIRLIHFHCTFEILWMCRNVKSLSAGLGIFQLLRETSGEQNSEHIFLSLEQNWKKKISFVYHQHLQFSVPKTPNMTGEILRSGWEIYKQRNWLEDFSSFLLGKEKFSSNFSRKEWKHCNWNKTDFLFDAFPEGLINLPPLPLPPFDFSLTKEHSYRWLYHLITKWKNAIFHLREFLQNSLPFWKKV